MVFFNACYSAGVGRKILEISDECKAMPSNIIAWEGAVPNRLCNMVAEAFYSNTLAEQWGENFNLMGWYKCQVENLCQNAKFEAVEIDPIRGDVLFARTGAYDF